MGAATISNQSSSGSLPAAFAALFLAPLFLSSNMVFGRAVLSVEPFTLAALRWSITAVILLLLCHGQFKTLINTFKNNRITLLSCGFFGFWVCGGVVYLALHTTSATNGILIYTTPPLLVMGIEAIFRGRAIRLRELLGIAFAVAGVFVIVLRGEFANLARLDFNPGDLMFVAASFSWAVYTVMLKSKSLSHLKTLPLLTLVSCCGALWLIPFAAYEIATTGKFPVSGYEWGIIAGIVLFASLASYASYQYGLAIVGASVASIFMYLLAPYGLLLAWLFLGERLQGFHLSGTALVMGGVVLATFPISYLKRKLGRNAV